ncbi:flagellin [Acidovorax sp. KKS102]|uniref:flagellin n=1 Tax=Acidovorax sp. KKS102 TaxID=358220 RepID=UPI00028B33B8|nr:flagellin [Acidovorax sp. KKS102]AFU47861.1 flagellin [Acidovorax sp. KKS102]
MAAVINTNVQSLNAQRNLGISQNSLATSMQRLSSGLRINSAKDDAAGLAISERMTTQIRGLNVAVRNANDGISLAQTAEGAMASVTNNLQRMRELAVQSANATNSSTDRAALQAEVSQLSQEIDRVATQTDFNGTKLLDGSFSAQAFQVGANAGQTITIDSIASARTSTLGKFQGINLVNQTIGTPSDTTAAATVTIGSGSAISLGTIANDAKAIASAINAAGISGMTASANATSVASVAADGTGVTAGNATITINGTALSVAASTNAASNRANALAAINGVSAVTGVIATDDGSGLKLAAADGRNITTAFAAGTATGSSMTAFGLAAAGTTGATVNISYAASGQTGNVVFANAMGNLSTAIGSQGTAVAALDISTVGGANTALTAIDAALTQINSSRAQLGAIQNRFSSTIDNLQTNSENLSASRSRIMDADFAQETANLSRSQILQQAGTAMVAQANQLPQNVLKLLQG